MNTDWSDVLRDLVPFVQFKKREKHGGVLLQPDTKGGVAGIIISWVEVDSTVHP